VFHGFYVIWHHLIGPYKPLFPFRLDQFLFHRESRPSHGLCAGFSQSQLLLTTRKSLARYNQRPCTAALTYCQGLRSAVAIIVSCCRGSGPVEPFQREASFFLFCRYQRCVGEMTQHPNTAIAALHMPRMIFQYYGIHLVHVCWVPVAVIVAASPRTLAQLTW
jgi:hypothetical protein